MTRDDIGFILSAVGVILYAAILAVFFGTAAALWSLLP